MGPTRAGRSKPSWRPHELAFLHLGGVHRRFRYDNLTAGVVVYRLTGPALNLGLLMIATVLPSLAVGALPASVSIAAT